MIQGTKIYDVTVSDAKVDNHKACDYEDWYTNNEEYNKASDDATDFEEKAKAYIRFQRVCQALNKGLDTMFDIVTTDDEVKVVASSIAFKLVYTQPDGLWIETSDAYDESLGKEGLMEQLRDGRVIYKGEKAIEAIIKQALKDDSKAIVEYFEPKASMDSNIVATSRKSDAPNGWTMKEMTIEGVEPTVTVKEVLDIETKLSLIKD